MSKFKIGDKVRTSIKLAEKHGDVYGIGAEFWEDSKTRKVLAVYDDDPARTDYKLSGTCFFWPEYALVSAEPREFIVIRRDKSDVIASHKRGDEIVKTAKATCAPSDEFNFETGAKLAFDRLMWREEPLYSCTESATVKPQPAPRFKVGDKVRGISDRYSFTNKNMTLGVVTKDHGVSLFPEDDMTVKVLENPLGFIGEEFSVESKYFELVKPVKEFIVIRREGNETIAELRHGREVVKSARTKCAPTDEFDFDTGAKLEFDRLMNGTYSKQAYHFTNPVKPQAEEKPKYYTGKVRAFGVQGSALDSGKTDGNAFVYDRVGVVFEFENGECKKLGMSGTRSFEEVQMVCDCSLFEEVKD